MSTVPFLLVTSVVYVLQEKVHTDAEIWDQILCIDVTESTLFLTVTGIYTSEVLADWLTRESVTDTPTSEGNEFVVFKNKIKILASINYL